MSLHPKAREAFAKAENAAWRVEQASFDAQGRITWVESEEPEPIQSRGLYEPSPRDREPSLEAVVSELGEVAWLSAMPVSEDPRKLTKLKRWFALSDADREDFLTRAKRNMPVDSHKAYAEYAGYCLFARGQHHPLSVLEFRALAKKTARSRSASKSRKRTNGQTPPKTVNNGSVT